MASTVDVGQGEIWWAEQPDDAPRPCLVLTRPAALPVLNAYLVAPLTRTRRGIATEVALGPPDGINVECVATFDNVRTVRRAALTSRVGKIADGRWHEVCAAMRTAIGC